MLLIRHKDGNMAFGFGNEEGRLIKALKAQADTVKNFDDQPEEFKRIVLMGNSIYMVSTHELNISPHKDFRPYALMSLYIYNGMYDRARRVAFLMHESVAFHPDATWRLQYKRGKLKKFLELVDKVCKHVKKGVAKYGKDEYFNSHFME